MRNRFDRRRTLLALGLSLTVFVAAARPTMARQATPAGTPDVPAAAECTVEPLDPMAILSLVQGGSADRDLLQATPVPEASLPEGPPATTEELDGITESVRLLVACANARNPLRLVALLTDDFKGALAGAALGMQGEDPEAIAARFPVPIVTEELATVEEVGMIPIRDARLLPDGRVAAILEPSVAGIDQVEGFFVTFELVDGSWLIDDIAILESDTGTPAPAA